jgi:hypothetical protein
MGLGLSIKVLLTSLPYLSIVLDTDALLLHYLIMFIDPLRQQQNLKSNGRCIKCMYKLTGALYIIATRDGYPRE